MVIVIISKEETWSNLRVVRGRIPEFPKDCNYVHNAVIFGAIRFSVDRGTPLFEYASHHRRSIQEAEEPDNIRTVQAVIREYARKKHLLLLCEPGDNSFHVTNWSAAWHGIDFTPAVERLYLETTQNQPTQKLRMLVLGQSRETSNSIHRCKLSAPPSVLKHTNEIYWFSLQYDSNG
jgi:hypothetical protein